MVRLFDIANGVRQLRQLPVLVSFSLMVTTKLSSSRMSPSDQETKVGGQTVAVALRLAGWSPLALARTMVLPPKGPELALRALMGLAQVLWFGVIPDCMPGAARRTRRPARGGMLYEHS